MDIEKLDEQYKTFKLKLQQFEKVKQRIADLEKEVRILSNQIQYLDVLKIVADKNNDKEQSEQIDKHLQPLLEQLRFCRVSLKYLKNMLEATQEKVTNSFQELAKNPNLQEYLNTVIEKKFTRQISQKRKEKETLLLHAEQLKTVKEAAEQNPYVMNIIKGIENHVRTIEQIESKTLADTGILYMTHQDQVDVHVEKAKLDMRRKDLLTYFKGKIPINVIESFTSYDDISKRISFTVVQTKGIDKQISNYETALDNLTLENADLHSSDKKHKKANNIDKSNRNNLPTTQSKLHQIFNKFRNWISNLINRKSSVKDSHVESTSQSKDYSSFKNALRYDIVRDYEAKLEHDLLVNAKAKNKANSQNKKNSGKDLSL